MDSRAPVTTISVAYLSTLFTDPQGHCSAATSPHLLILTSCILVHVTSPSKTIRDTATIHPEIMQPPKVQMSTGIVKGHHKGRDYNFLSRVQLARLTGLPKSKLGH